MQIDRAATFKAKILDHGVGLTKNKFPQFAAKFLGVEIYDTEESEWVDWTDMEENEITGYFVLFGRDNAPTLNMEQVKKAVGWDGISFKTLNEMDLSEVVVQIRVEDHEYDGKKSLQVNWIDAEDATPGTGVRKLGEDELKKLDAAFGKFMKQTKPSKAPAKSKPSAKKDSKKKSKGKGSKKKDSPPAPPTPPASAGPPEKQTESTPCTKQEAWDTACDAREPDTTDSALATMWLDAVEQVESGSGISQDDFTRKNWGLVRDMVITAIDIPF